MKVKELAEIFKISATELLAILPNVGVDVSQKEETNVDKEVEKKLAKRYGVPYPFKKVAPKPKTPTQTLVKAPVKQEVGHGGSGSVPAGVTEAISVDMGCVGSGLGCTEKQVSICAKDSGGPYSYDVVGKLIEAAKATGADYAVDVYPMYGSDVEATLRSGYDIRHGLIGPGVYASHGYERSHMDGVYNTLKVLVGYTEV